MKKLVLGALALLVALSLVACGEVENEVIDEPNNNEVVDVIEDDNNEPEIVDQEVSGEEVSGEEVSGEVVEEKEFDVVKVITLAENPTTGYTWSYAIADETVAVVEGDEYTPAKVEDGMVGAGGTHAYRVSGLKEGETTITFTYARSWESGEEPANTATYTLKVNANNEISVVEM